MGDCFCTFDKCILRICLCFVPNKLIDLLSLSPKVLNVLHTNASQVAAMDLGFKAGGMPAGGAPKVVYLLGAEDTDIKANGTFVVYQGKHG